MNGLFIGLTTLDFIYLTANFPQQNEKIVALNQCITAGGPATNAAVTFSYLGNQATLLGVIGNHPISQLIRADLASYSLNIRDLDPFYSQLPPVSSIIVTQSTGERAVISLNATKFQGIIENIPVNILDNIEIILIDGHQRAVSQEIARKSQAKNIPVVIDGGSWKPEFEKVLPYVNYAICSANFYPPNCHNQNDVFSYLRNLGIPNIAITQGEKPIQYFSQGGFGEVEITAIQVVDTLGAGDIFHGAFCHYILHNNFLESLSKSSQVAASACQFFGPRQWMKYSRNRKSTHP